MSKLGLEQFLAWSSPYHETVSRDRGQLIKKPCLPDKAAGCTVFFG
jgi:hypothetical protein